MEGMPVELKKLFKQQMTQSNENLKEVQPMEKP